MCLIGNAATLAQEQASLRIDATEQIHDERRIRTSDAEIDHRDVASRHGTHGGFKAHMRHVHLVAKQIYVVIKIRQKNVLAKRLQRHFGVTNEPVSNNFLLCNHK